jgi:hypothetical protein
MGIFANSGELQSGSMVKYESLNPFLCEDLFLIPIIHRMEQKNRRPGSA